jgi:hypothetical protein
MACLLWTAQAEYCNRLQGHDWSRGATDHHGHQPGRTTGPRCVNKTPSGPEAQVPREAHALQLSGMQYALVPVLLSCSA